MRSPAPSRRSSPRASASRARAIPLTLAAAAFGLAIGVPPALAVPQAVSQEAPAAVPATLPVTPAAIAEIVVMRPFVLEEGFTSDWSADRPLVRSGWLIVVGADAALLRPRQTQEPILFIGDRVAERLNAGVATDGAGPEPASTGYTVVIVPAEVMAPAPGAPAGSAPSVTPVLVDHPAFFGTPGTAETITPQIAAAELAQAVAAGLTAPAAPMRNQALARGGDLLQVADRAALLASAAALVRTWSPSEAARALELEGLPIPEDAAPAPEAQR